MLRQVAAIFLVAAVGANAAWANTAANSASGSYVYAEVVQADPIIEIVREPVRREFCTDTRAPRKKRSSTPLIVGGIIGGVIGNQFGSGSGRAAATVAGAALGGSLGADRSRRRSEGGNVQRHCEVSGEYREYERVAGYRVKYRYEGEIHTAETREHPGQYLKLELSVAPS